MSIVLHNTTIAHIYVAFSGLFLEFQNFSVPFHEFSVPTDNYNSSALLSLPIFPPSDIVFPAPLFLRHPAFYVSGHGFPCTASQPYPVHAPTGLPMHPALPYNRKGRCGRSPAAYHRSRCWGSSSDYAAPQSAVPVVLLCACSNGGRLDMLFSFHSLLQFPNYHLTS